MRGGGAGRWFAVVLSLLLALSAPIASLRFIGFFLFLLLGAAMLYNLLVRSALSVRRLDAEVRGMRYQRMESRLSLGNRLALPVPRLIVTETAGPLHCDGATREVTLPARGEAEIPYALWSERRGEYRYGPVRVVGSDPFAFFQWEREVPSVGRAIVYPRVYPLELITASGAAGGSLPSGNPAFEDITRFRSVREYTAGDELKRINWKISAKTGRLFTTEYERTQTSPVRIVLNLMSDDFPLRRRDQLIERAIEVAAALVFSYARRGQPVGLVAAAVEGGERSSSVGHPTEAPVAGPVYGEHTGWRHAELILECLARIRPAAGTADYLELASGAARGMSTGLRFLFVGPETTEAQIAELTTLRTARVRAEMFELRSTDSPASRGALEGVLPLHPVRDFGEELLEQ